MNTLFTKSKYTNWYMSIIENAKSRKLIGYSENHHIWPKSIGGHDVKENKVRLTAREHFICHRLLPKMTVGMARSKMAHALWYFLGNKKHRTLKITSRTYATMKKLKSEAMRVPQTQESIAKRVLANTGKKRSETQKANLKSGQATYLASVNPEVLKERGTKSAITREIRGNANGGRPIGTPMTDEQKAKQSAMLKGIKKSPESVVKVNEGLKRYFSTIDKAVLQERSQKGAPARSEALKKYYKDLGPEAMKNRSEMLSVSRGKIWDIEAQDGSVFQINNFTIFCKEHNLNNKAFAKTVLNKRFINGFRIA
jgi:hypothetical protein